MEKVLITSIFSSSHNVFKLRLFGKNLIFNFFSAKVFSDKPKEENKERKLSKTKDISQAQDIQRHIQETVVSKNGEEKTPIKSNQAADKQHTENREDPHTDNQSGADFTVLFSVLNIIIILIPLLTL